MEVRPSTIAGAGWGAFATRRYKRGETVAVYGGVRGLRDPIYTMQCGSVYRSAADPSGKLRWNTGTMSPAMHALPPPESRSSDLVGVAYVPGDGVTNMTRFINHQSPGANLRIGKQFCLQAHRTIEAGDELLFNYGSAYTIAK